MGVLERLVVRSAATDVCALPASHIVEVQVTDDFGRLGILRICLVAEVEIEKAARPVGIGVGFAVPRSAVVVDVVVAIEIGQAVGMETEVDGEAAHRLGQSVDAAAIGRTQQRRVGEEVQQTPGMDGCHHEVGRIEVVGRGHSCGLVVVARDAFGT